MLGAITGDIVGSRYEFNNTDNYNFELFTKDSPFTDDTICTIAVADAINTGANYKDKFLQWCRACLLYTSISSSSEIDFAKRSRR